MSNICGLSSQLNFPSIALGNQQFFAQGSQSAATPPAAAGPQIRDTYVAAQANLNSQGGLSIQLGGNAQSFANAAAQKGINSGSPSLGDQLAGAWNWLSSKLFPGNPPLPQAPSQPAAPSGPQFDAKYVAQMQAKYSAAFDAIDANKDGLLTGTELQNGVVNFDPANNGMVTKAQFIQQGIADEEASRTFAANQATTNPAAAAQSIGAIYQNVLGRAPSPQELGQCMNAMANGTTTDDLQSALQSSPEAQVRAAYKAVFGHDFIGTSRDWYLGQLKAQGGDVDAVKQAMLRDRAFYQKNGVGY